jgi:hypothetical protein
MLSAALPGHPVGVAPLLVAGLLIGPPDVVADPLVNSGS